MTDGILDFLTMILVLAIVLGIAFGLVFPLVNTDLMRYNDTIKDKSVLEEVKDYSIAVEGGFVPHEPTMNPLEVVLMSQVQDVNMPLPRSFRVGSTGGIIEIESTYRLVMRDVGITLWGRLPSRNINEQYIVEYTYKGSGGKTFEIKRK